MRGLSICTGGVQSNKRRWILDGRSPSWWTFFYFVGPVDKDLSRPETMVPQTVADTSMWELPLSSRPQWHHLLVRCCCHVASTSHRQWRVGHSLGTGRRKGTEGRMLGQPRIGSAPVWKWWAGGQGPPLRCLCGATRLKGARQGSSTLASARKVEAWSWMLYPANYHNATGVREN
jgi:hypothetical protein